MRQDRSRQAQRELEQAIEVADAANRAKSEFLANMSHEIRTPLHGVVGMAEMLMRSPLPERDREMVEIIRSSGHSLGRLLSDVLDLARVEAGRLPITLEPLHVGDTVRAVAALCRVKADEKGVALGAEVADAADGWFLGDVTRIRQILTNLASNAVKFTAEGEVCIKAELGGDGALKLPVRDTGVGFDPARKEQVFGRFQQADASITRHFGGTGLGLAISKHLAELMGGGLEGQERLRREFQEKRGYWSDLWNCVLQVDPGFFEAYLQFSSAPWTSGVLEPKVKELVYIAIDVSTTHLYEPGLRLHVRNALGYGATAAEIIEVFELASLLGIQAMAQGAPAVAQAFGGDSASEQIGSQTGV